LTISHRNKKTEFVNWLRLGTKDMKAAAGVPLTISAWAEANEVSRITCQRWKAEPEVMRAVTDLGISMFTIDELAKAREKLVSRAIDDGHVPAIMAMLRMAGMDGTRPNPEQTESAVISAFSSRRTL